MMQEERMMMIWCEIFQVNYVLRFFMRCASQNWKITFWVLHDQSRAIWRTAYGPTKKRLLWNRSGYYTHTHTSGVVLTFIRRSETRKEDASSWKSACRRMCDLLVVMFLSISRWVRQDETLLIRLSHPPWTTLYIGSRFFWLNLLIKARRSYKITKLCS